MEYGDSGLLSAEHPLKETNTLSEFSQSFVLQSACCSPKSASLVQSSTMFIYWLFCLRWCRDAAVSLSNTFFLRVFYLHSSILSHLFILNISLVFLVIIQALQRKEVVCLFSDKCEFFPLLQGVVTAQEDCLKVEETGSRSDWPVKTGETLHEGTRWRGKWKE